VASALPATSGTGDDAPSTAAPLVLLVDTAPAAAAGTGPDDRAHVTTAETSRDRAFILEFAALSLCVVFKVSSKSCSFPLPRTHGICGARQIGGAVRLAANLASQNFNFSQDSFQILIRRRTRSLRARHGARHARLLPPPRSRGAKIKQK